MIEGLGQESPSRRLQWLEIWVVISLTVAPYLFRAIFRGLIGNREVLLGFEFWAAQHVLSSAGPILATLYIILRSKEGLAGFSLVPPRFGRDLLLAIALLAGLYLCSTMGLAVGHILNYVFHTGTGAADLRPMFPRPSWADLPTLIVMSAINGVGEELTMRGFLVNRLRGLLSQKWVAYVVPNVLFGSYHLYQGVTPAISYTVWGMLVTIVMLESKSLWPAVLSHAAADVFGLLQFLKV